MAANARLQSLALDHVWARDFLASEASIKDIDFNGG
jgi:endonuclease/exonuclease/phosphatase (EEP) superfamily protein YafD